VDDETTLCVTWSFIRVPQEREPFVQAEIPTWTSPVRDAASGRWITSHVINQDIVAWVGQGAVTDRSRETLGASDRGIAMLRRQLAMDIEAVAAGRDPKGVLRDPAANQRIVLPSDHREFFLHGLPLADYLRHPKWGRLLQGFIFHAGQPAAVRQACEAALGVPQREITIVDL
jgi:5,5'-dehydrodivanillate O-demethylase